MPATAVNAKATSMAPIPRGYVGDCDEMKNCGPMILPTAAQVSLYRSQRNSLQYHTIHESTSDPHEALLRSPSSVGATQTQGEYPRNVVKSH